MVAARHSWIVGFDNVSYISLELSDALCRLSYGGTMSKRALWTNADEFSMNVCRPVVLNGIPDRLVTRPDLLDRCIILKAPLIPNRNRKHDLMFWKEFEEVRPFILGDLLDGVAAGLRDAPGIKVENPSRLLHFEQFAEAGCRGLGFEVGEFDAAFKVNRAMAGGAALEDDPVAQAIIILANSGEKFFGQAHELLHRLGWHICERAELKKSERWPKDGARLSATLRRLAPLLRQSNIEIEFDQYISRTNNRGIKVAARPMSWDETLKAAEGR